MRCSIYNDWMIDEWCGGDGRGRLDPADARAAVGPRSSRPPRCGAARRRAATRSRSPRTRRSSASRRSTRGDWDPLWDACSETDTTVSMHIGSSSSMPHHVRRRAARDVDVAQRAERAGLAVRLGVLRHARALPDASRSPTPRARSAGCRTCSSAWTSSGTRASAASTSPTPPSELRARPRLRLRLRRPARPASSRDAVGLEHDPVRDRLPAHRRHVAELARGRRTACAARRGMDAAECRAAPARQRDRAATASNASGSRAGRDVDQLAGRGLRRARPSRRRAARRGRPAQPPRVTACSTT